MPTLTPTVTAAPSSSIGAHQVDRDHLLTNVMLCWLTGTAALSSRIYYENAHGSYLMSMQRSETPTGVAVLDRGGHFAAMEALELLAGDIRAFFRAVSRKS